MRGFVILNLIQYLSKILFELIKKIPIIKPAPNIGTDFGLKLLPQRNRLFVCSV